jgi:catechol 2,3-dioxygenase-like lactoylglutathione lyase family enzyme
MHAQHIGLVSLCEENADRFYRDFLGLEKSKKNIIPSSLMKPLFDIDAEIVMCNYSGHGVQFEIFFYDDPEEFSGRIAHTCLKLRQADALLARAEKQGIRVLRASKGEKWVTFIEDFDGNKFEIKQA